MVEGWIEIIGLVFGISGVAIAIYSVIQQRKLETRLKEKERLKKLAKRLDNVINSMREFYEIKGSPSGWSDSYEFDHLQMLSQRIISEAFNKKKDIISLSIETRIGIEEVTKTSEGKEKKETKYISAERTEDVIKYLEEGKLSSIDIETGFGDESRKFAGGTISYDISEFLNVIRHFFYELETLEKEFGDLMEEFSPELLKSLKECVKGMLMVEVGSAMRHKEIEIDTKAFSKTDDIGLWIYNTIMRSEEINPYLDKLVELKAKFEKLRESLITTSYT